MAEGKKSFIVYADWKSIFDELPNEEAGQLIKHIFSYVNDENPVSDSVLIRAVFAQIKTTLKRDLSKWENQLQQRREAGKASAESRRNKSNDRSTIVNELKRNSTDNVSVSVNDSVKEIDNSIFLKESLLSETWLESVCMQSKKNKETIKSKLHDYCVYLTSIQDQKSNHKEFRSHFTRWVCSLKTNSIPSSGSVI